MTTPELFSKVQINGRDYRLQHVEGGANGGQVWMVSNVRNGTMYRVSVAADGSFGAVVFAY